MGLPLGDDRDVQDVVPLHPAQGRRLKLRLGEVLRLGRGSAHEHEAQYKEDNPGAASKHARSIVKGVRPVIPTFALALLLGCLGCADSAASLSRHEVALAQEDFDGAEQSLRDGLERHPRDVPLLCAAASFYLRAQPEATYKPRLALHYALRADQAAKGTDGEAVRLLARAHRAAGGLTALPQGEALLAAGLEQVGHPDAGSPKRLKPFDSDLLDPTLENLLEQKLRWELGKKQPTCPEQQLLVPEGNYPLEDPSGATVSLAAFCVERMPSLDLGCAGTGLRQCTGQEEGVVRTTLRAMLWGDRQGHRCCAESSLARVKH